MHQPVSRQSGAELPVVTVSDITTAAFNVVLQYMYTGEVQALPPAFLQPHAAAGLFDAADRLLQFPMKVMLTLDQALSKLPVQQCCAAVLRGLLKIIMSIEARSSDDLCVKSGMLSIPT